MVSAPAVIADWFALSVARTWACTPESCSALSCSGPVLSQRTMVSTLVDSSAASAGTPRTKVMTTKVSTPPSSGEAADHHQRRRDAPGDAGGTCSRWTAGESKRGEQQRDRDRDDDRGQVGHDDADHVQRGHHHQQPPSRAPR